MRSSSDCWDRKEVCGRIRSMSNLQEHAVYELLSLPEEQQEEHAEAILERSEKDTVYIEGVGQYGQ